MEKNHEELLGKEIHVLIDRPLGTAHPNYPDMIYPINYGYVEGIMAGDQEEQDVYVLGVDEPVQEYDGKIIAIIVRNDDNEEKWVVSNQSFTKEEIQKQVYFCEQYFDSYIVM